MRKAYSILLLFFLLLVNTIHARAKIQIYDGGFSFGSILPNETITNSLLKDNGGVSYINQLLVNKSKVLSNKSFDLSYDLLKDGISEEDQNIMVLALDGEYIDSISIKSDNLTRTDIILNFQIIFFNAKTNSLVASIPLEISKNIPSNNKLSKDQIKQELKTMYENEVAKYYFDLLKNFNLQNKYKNRIGVTNVIFEDNAKEYFKKNMNKEDIFLKNRFAKSLSSFIAFNNDVAIVPFAQDRSSNTIMLRFENSQREINLPNPDYHIHLTIRGFKSVLFKESNINEQWIYGSYTNIKILQPDYPDEQKRIKMDEKFKSGLNVELSKRSLDNKQSFEWIFYNDSLKVLFDNFSKQTVELDKKWLKSSNGNKKISKKFKEIKEIYDRCK
tara:strand:+ start:5050 stop:6210 length:1161 start_codon:yes stop_codon:yes gene_type:complete